MKRWLVAAVSMTVCLSAGLRAEEACKMVQLKNPAPTLSEIYGMAEKAAKAWKPDAVPAQISTTSLGPLQPNGSAGSWNIQFYSKAADSHVAMNVFRGTMTCWADKGPAGRIPDLKPDFFKDGAALYAIAKKEGGEYIAKGFNVDLGSSAAPSTNHAMWYLNFSKEKERNAPLTIVVDANTGKVEKVLKD
jgi:hypothetical protein